MSALITILFALSPSFAAEIRQSQSADGIIEFSNQNIPEGNAATSHRQTIIYKTLNNQGDGVIFSDQKPLSGEFEVLRYDCFACNPDSSIDWHTIALNTRDYHNEISQLSAKHNVDPALVRAVIHAESAFRVDARSAKGAQGLMQLMPGTAKDMGVKNAFNAKENIEGGIKYLALMLSTFDQNTRLATAAYNAGPGAVKRYKGIPPYEETEVYVERVAILHQRYRNSAR
ncbi:lytic transglycosylase [Methylophaga frappieri]|uniref:Lytic transglycosylase n=1 Tax=Methylophaga frappieri (strain ATCC BAA-2434 / DSM 25690 / JAM7) TaxID=754477 RepID=I1YKZ1_METFJ|nr:lytic transglycosylase domain-containing protein [Methylophaga frappieri]AFJ03584.1 lytic transglycosylase [Methylophaga frappieri]